MNTVQPAPKGLLRPVRRSFLFFLCALFLLVPLDAHAKRDPAKVFRGQIITSKKRLPTQAKSPQAYIQALKKAKSTKFQEDTEKQRWKIYFAAFFRKPLNDLEVTVNLYDITNGTRHLVSSFEQFTSDRGQTTLLSNIVLERKFFGVNKKILMTMESKKSILAQGTFHILGKGETFSGKVDFTEDE